MGKGKAVNPLEGNILKNMLHFALPIMGMMLMSTLFASVDTMVIGQFGHKNAVSAIGASASLINMVSGGLTCLEGGVTIVLSRLYGEGKKDRIGEIVNLLPLTGMILGGVTALVMIPFARPLLLLLNCPGEVLADAILYFRIYFLTMVFSLPYQFLAGALNAKGDSVTPFQFQIIAEGVNILLNLFTVIVLDWNIFGVAIATFVSQAVSFLLIVHFFAKRDDELHMDLKKLKAFTGMGEIFRLGVPASLEGVIINFSGVVVSAYINRFSTDVIAGSTIGQAIEGFVQVSFVAFASAGTVFVSQNYGAGNLKRVRQCYTISAFAVTAAVELLGILLYLASPVLIRLFTSSPEIARYARVRMFWMCMFYGLGGGMNIITGCINGLQDTKGPLVISVISSVLIRLCWVIFIAGPSGDINMIFMAFPLCWGISTVLSLLLFELDFHKAQKAAAADEHAVR